MITLGGREYAETSAEAARELGVDATNVRDWVRRATTPPKPGRKPDRLYGVITPYRHGGRTYLAMDQLSRAELMVSGRPIPTGLTPQP